MHLSKNTAFRLQPQPPRLRRKVESGPRGRGQCAGEPFLGRWSSPRFIRHSGLADTAHRTDCRVEPLFTNVGSTSVDHPPALQAGFYCGSYGPAPEITSLVRGVRGVLCSFPPLLEPMAQNTSPSAASCRCPEACPPPAQACDCPSLPPAQSASSACPRYSHRPRAGPPARHRHRS